MRQVYANGVTRAEVRANVRAGRWRRAGRQCLVVHVGPLGDRAREWVSVLDAGPRACLDGASALIAEGLKNFTMDQIRVSVPRGAKVIRSAEVNVRQTRRLHPDDVVRAGVPRTRPAVAAVRAALWARTDREATLVLAMTVQQRLCSPGDMATEMLRIRRDKRRVAIQDVLVELAGGAESLGEIDVARECHARGLPEPTRQAVRRGEDGRYYLDVLWEEYGVVLEIDGIQHNWADHVVGDALRHNRIALSGDVVLRLPVMGLRWAADDFFRQVEEALRKRGWRPGARGA